MESSQVLQGTEETHSCESGWTMYIGSPMDGVNNIQDSDAEEIYGKVNYNGKYQSESDDSMASDASSGPIRHCLDLLESGEYGQDMAQFEHGKDKEEYYKADKKAKKKNTAGEKRRAERRKEEKEGLVLIPRRANTAALSGTKVRRDRMGNRK